MGKSSQNSSETVLSEPESFELSASPIPNPPPDGGLQAWLQVLGAHLLFFSSSGIVSAFGAFQTFYESHYLTSSSPSAISWIGTIQGFLLIVIGTFTGPVYDSGYLRTLINTGAFLITFGLLMASVSTEYYQILLSLGICTGLGCGCLFIPSVAVAATYFSSKRAIATGLAAAGGSIGGIIFPIVFRLLIEEVGYGWATRVMAFIVLTTLSVSLLVLRPRALPTKKRALVDTRALQDFPFILFSFALFFMFIGLYVPFFYIPSFARDRLGNTISDNFSFYILSIMNASSVLGRIIPNLLADRFGSFSILIPSTLITSALAFAWIGIDSVASIVVFCVLYGFFSGAIVSLPGTAIVMFCPDLSTIGTRMGMSFGSAGFGLLIGSPIGGRLLQAEEDYSGLQAWSGATVAGSCMILSLALLMHSRALKA
ncbi:major facilitator superfamily domain-containing protein [Macrophomina phaseolina]|uniref:Major facilitator superfamily domain-containing protein n=1 Tax=Macrophomina phaseolina TaxID=35725 RepID=A0ABQ8GFR8_9PEZI|nr:major facilitator superfamily domain-containing protein [Macrophomina phaseolina]